MRPPAVAGLFYPKAADALRELIRQWVPAQTPRAACRAVIVPHGAFQYSGRVVGETLGQVAVPKRCIILGPNHAGWGSPWSVMADGRYQTPLGDVAIDEALAGALLAACPLLTAERVAHQGEHAIEVLLPFLQWVAADALSIVPIVVNSDEPQECAQVADAVAGVIRRWDESVLLIASADLTHYEPRAMVEQKDTAILEAIRHLDVEELDHRLAQGQPVTCGHAVIRTTVDAAVRLGATGAHVVRYATSADAGGDPHSAIGYAGIILT